MDIFKKKKAASEAPYDYTIRQIARLRSTTGDIGIEIECEGNKFQKQDLPAWWTYHKDGSLRGKDNAEYVLKRPIKFSEVEAALKDLWDMFKECGTILDESNRTSVHIHLNMQSFHLNRLTAFMALYFSVEELLTEWCGDHRVGNLFCLRARDATAIVTKIKRFIETDGKTEFTDGMHYAGMNAQSLQKFGSLEIRSLRGVNDPKIILQWIEMLRSIYDLSANFPDPRDIPGLLSSEGAMNYLDMVLGQQNAYVLKQGIAETYPTDKIYEALYTGIRLAQDLCFCRDWSTFKPAPDGTPDPFGRVKIGSVGGGASAYAPVSHTQWYVEQLASLGLNQGGAVVPTATTNEAWNLVPPIGLDDDVVVEDPTYDEEFSEDDTDE